MDLPIRSSRDAEFPGSSSKKLRANFNSSEPISLVDTIARSVTNNTNFPRIPIMPI
jgi:hypothetical protein